jgi:stage III sporulation protein AG
MIKVFGNRDGVIKAISVIIIVAVLILSFDVFTQNKDGRKQIVDQDGGIESELCIILSDIEGVGNVDVMLQYDEDDKITGAIVTADGAGNPVVKNNLINAVMAVFNISSASVEVFEKKSVEEQEGTFNEK